MANHKKPTLIYILAPSFSGSTLLTMLLARHPLIATIGELNFKNERWDMDLFRCSCGELARRCSFWNRLSNICAERGLVFSVDNFDTSIDSKDWIADKLLKATYRNRIFTAARLSLINLIPGAANELRDKIKRIFEVGQAICEAQNGRVILDGSKSAVRLFYFIKSEMWDVKVIYLTRDGRGVTYSNMCNRKLAFRDAMRLWKRVAGELLRFRSTLPPASVIDVKYEDLCRNPSVTLSSILESFDLPEFEIVGSELEANKKHIMGNVMRLTFQSEIKEDERWKTALTKRELQIFEQRASDLNRRLGYS